MSRNFSRVLFHIPMGSPDDAMDGWAALNNVLANAHNAGILVNVNFETPPFTDRQMKVLHIMAALNKNKLWFEYHDPNVSLAQMVAKTVPKGYDWFLNHDCDLMFTSEAFSELSAHAIQRPGIPAIYQFFDIANCRGYHDYEQDWEFRDISEVGAREMAFRRSGYTKSQALSAPVWTGAFMVPLPFRPGLWQRLREWPKGLRGYDKAVVESCKNHRLLQGAVAYHKGVFSPLINERWNSFEPGAESLPFIPQSKPNV